MERRPPRPVLMPEATKMRDWYEAGVSIREIAARLKRPFMTVSSTLDRLGVEKRRRGTPLGAAKIPRHEVTMAGFMYGALHMTMQEIADTMGIALASARLRVYYSGTPLRTRSESQRLRSRDRRRA